MFDIAFSELLIIGVIALIVIGPERLPKLARTAGTWIGRLNRYVAQVKGDIDREMRIEELRKLQDEMKASVQKYELLAEEAGKDIKREVEQVDRVVKAMAATDGGLTLREYEKLKAEEAAAPPAGGEAEPAAAAEAPAPDAFRSSVDEQVDVDSSAPTAPERPADRGV